MTRSDLVEGTRVDAVCPECKDTDSSFKSLKEPGRAICVGCRCSYNIWEVFKGGVCQECYGWSLEVNFEHLCINCFEFDKKDCQPGEPLVEKGE